MLGLFHHNFWGSPGAGGAIQVSLVSSALPLPPDEVNKNVLATETPSKAPAPPSPKEQRHVDETAIPILGKQAKPAKKNTHEDAAAPAARRRRIRRNTASSRDRSCRSQMQPGTAGQTTVGDNNFASLYPWYVDGINRTMAQNWNKYEVDPPTPKGARVLHGLHGSPRRHA